MSNSVMQLQFIMKQKRNIIVYIYISRLKYILILFLVFVCVVYKRKCEKQKKLLHVTKKFLCAFLSWLLLKVDILKESSSQAIQMRVFRLFQKFQKINFFEKTQLNPRKNFKSDILN